MKISKGLLFFVTAFILLGGVLAYELLPVYNPFGKHLQYITTGNFTGDSIIVENLTVTNNAVINNNLTVSDIIISRWFNGLFNWTILNGDSRNYLKFDGSNLQFNSTFANSTYDSRYVNINGDTMTGNLNISNKNVTTVDCIIGTNGGELCFKSI